MGKVSVSLAVSFGLITYFWMRWSVRCGYNRRHRRSSRKKAYLYSQVLETRGTVCRAIWGSPKVGRRQWTRGGGEGLVQSFIGVSTRKWHSFPRPIVNTMESHLAVGCRVCRQEGPGLDAGGATRRAWWHVLQKPRWGPEHGEGIGDGESKQMWAGLVWGSSKRADDRN